MIEHDKTAFIHSSKFEEYEFGPHHPFKPIRSRLVYDLCVKHGLLDCPWMSVEEPVELDLITLASFHDMLYLHYLKAANDGEFEPKMIEFNIGTGECPVFKGIFDYAALAAGAGYRGMMALLQDGVQIAFSPTGGYHHAGRRHAEGFCYINDVGIVIDVLLQRGRRVAYIDIDAHHGNGIQNAFYSDPRVLKISLHESGETLYPWEGFETETGEGEGAGYNVNVPLPAGTDDEMYINAFDAIVPPIVGAFNPDIVVAVVGIDTMAADPLTHLRLTNNGFCDAVTRIKALGKPMLALGGGGYNLDSLARSWTLAWAVLNDIEPEDEHVGTIGGMLLGQQEIPGGSLRDMRQFASGPQKENIESEIKRVVEYLKKAIFPAHSL